MDYEWHAPPPLAWLAMTVMFAGRLALAGDPSAASALESAYQFPHHKQGVNDIDLSPHVPLEKRYDAIGGLGIGIKIYNYFWIGLDTSGAPSTADFSACSPGYAPVPASPADFRALGYHRYHCYNQATIAQFDELLALDVQHGFQSAIVMWATPPLYREPQCTGLFDGTPSDTYGCVPKDDAMGDYQDYVTFLAHRYNGSGHGKISHYIVWNEVASGQYFNMSPHIDITHAVTDPHQRNLWTGKYVEMMRLSTAAVRRHNPSALVEVSLDLNFISNQVPGSVLVPNIGGKAILDALWAQLGTSADWSVAVHSYYEPDIDYGANIINFYGLPRLAAYQAKELQKRGIEAPHMAPQYWLFCSEQGWFNVEESHKARNICKAHNIVMAMPNVIGTTHNYFQALTESDDATALIPANVGELLQGGPHSSTYQAYASTGGDTWGKRSDHYCCQTLLLGCQASTSMLPVPAAADAPVIGHVDGIENSPQGPLLRGWACMVGSNNPILVNIYAGGPAGQGTIVGAAGANDASEKAISQACGGTGMSYRFDIPLAGYLRTFAGQSIYVHGISTSGSPNSLLTDSGVYSFPKMSPGAR